MTEREQWTATDVAEYLGVRHGTVTSYKAREQMPPPDGHLGRTPWWWDDTIRAWNEARKGKSHD